MGLSFWDKYNSKLWVFSNDLYDYPPILKGPTAKISITFQVPKYIQGDVFVHAGIHLTGQFSPHYVENLRNKIKFSIYEDPLNRYQQGSDRFIAPATVKVLDN